MRVRWPLFATVLSIGFTYAAYPYATLYRLGEAVRGGDTGALESMVDWPAVREGIKEDVCDLAADDPNAKNPSELPGFGASFLRGIESSAIDQAVTPRALLAATATLPTTNQPAVERGADVHVGWAFFDSPTTFMVSLQAHGQSEPIKLELDLKHGKWQVQRVWLPPELLTHSPAKT